MVDQRLPKVRVSNECLGVGNCVGIAPEVFALDEEGHSTVLLGQIPVELIDAVETAVRSCPTGAIEILATPPPGPSLRS